MWQPQTFTEQGLIRFKSGPACDRPDFEQTQKNLSVKQKTTVAIVMIIPIIANVYYYYC